MIIYSAFYAFLKVAKPLFSCVFSQTLATSPKLSAFFVFLAQGLAPIYKALYKVFAEINEIL
nr:hypothetical protein [uncultured Campylobacter sp.]